MDVGRAAFFPEYISANGITLWHGGVDVGWCVGGRRGQGGGKTAKKISGITLNHEVHFHHCVLDYYSGFQNRVMVFLLGWLLTPLRYS